MCGICGELAFGAGAPAPDPERLARMVSALVHRGPDDAGVYVAPPAALGHRRLRIIDLATGRQPMANEDGTVWVVYNGEVYNYRELAAELAARGHRFRSSSDTEVIVHLYEEAGEACVEHLQGMFAFALWDARRRQLLLARDRVGIKPLYYALAPDRLLFASEVKAILAHGSFEARLDPAALDTFLTYLYMPGEVTLFAGILKLPPGHYLVARPDGRTRLRQYWDLPALPRPAARRFRECVAALEDLLRRTVRNHLISDVPVGVLLSGGVDSTAVLGFAAEALGRPVQTFTIGFDAADGPDERPYARLAARHFGAEHHETTLSAETFFDTLPRYVWHMEEPVCEPPGIALYHVAALASGHVTVLLSGEGGDEAFAGYQTYRNLLWLERAKRLLGPAAHLVAGLLRRPAARRALGRLAKYAALVGVPFERYYYSRAATPFGFFNALKAELYTDDFRAAVGQNGTLPLAARLPEPLRQAPLLSRMLYVDTRTWLPDDLLVKADKLTMAHAVELRVPLLDHQVLEFAAALPPSYKLRGWSGKRILKATLAPRIPRAIITRPKAGFVMPTGRWLQGPLRDRVREVLTDRRTLQRGYFKPDLLRALLDGRRAPAVPAKGLFSLLVLEHWHRIFLDGSSSTRSPADRILPVDLAATVRFPGGPWP